MDRTQAAKEFYERELNLTYSKQRETAAFHLLGLQLDSIESKYDHNSGAVGKGIWIPPEEEVTYVEIDEDPFDGA